MEERGIWKGRTNKDVVTGKQMFIEGALGPAALADDGMDVPGGKANKPLVASYVLCRLLSSWVGAHFSQLLIQKSPLMLPQWGLIFVNGMH